MRDSTRPGREGLHEAWPRPQIATEFQGEGPVPSLAPHGERSREEGLGPVVVPMQEHLVLLDQFVEPLTRTTRLGPHQSEQVRRRDTPHQRQGVPDLQRVSEQ